MKNRKFMFASWAVFCVSVVTILKNLPPETYQIIVLAIVGGFLGMQTLIDHKKNGDK